jgi:hypothetical protein
MAIMTKEGENLYSYAMDMGWDVVFTPDIAFSLGWGEIFLEDGRYVFIRPSEVANMTLLYHDDMSDPGRWITSNGYTPSGNGSMVYYNVSTTPLDTFSIFTNNISFANPDGLYVVLRFMANITDPYGRLYGYSGVNESGPLSFYTSGIRPPLAWRNFGWYLPTTDGYADQSLNCISLEFYGTTRPYTLFLDELWIYQLP